MSEIRISSNAVTYDTSIFLYASSKETTNLDPKFYKIIPGSSTANKFGSFTGGFNDIIDYPGLPGGNNGGIINNPPPGVTNLAPNLSDITVTKNQVVYDSAGKPTVTVVFKIKNSSGVSLKGVNTRVSVM